MTKPRTIAQWLAVLGPEYQPTAERPLDVCVCVALERLHTGLNRERHAWGVLLAEHGLGRTVRDVKKALAGNVVWPEEPTA